MGFEWSTNDGTRGKHKWIERSRKETGNCNITPIVALRHCQNTLITIDVPPGVGVIDIVIISTQDGRMHTTESDGGDVNVCSGGMGMMRSTESPSRRGRGKSVCQRRGHQANQSCRRSGLVG